MFLISSSPRRLFFKLRRSAPFYFQLIIVLFIFVFLFDKMVFERRLFRRKSVAVQNDLLNYNEDNLRQGWPFQITKHYDINELRTYTSKPKILPRYDLPGERGEKRYLFFN